MVLVAGVTRTFDILLLHFLVCGFVFHIDYVISVPLPIVLFRISIRDWFIFRPGHTSRLLHVIKAHPHF